MVTLCKRFATFHSPEYYQFEMKIKELRFIAKSTNPTVIGICEAKLDA